MRFAGLGDKLSGRESMRFAELDDKLSGRESMRVSAPPPAIPSRASGCSWYRDPVRPSRPEVP